MTQGARVFRPCVIVPTYNNPRTLRAVVTALAPICPVIVVDDASTLDAVEIAKTILHEQLADVVFRHENGGKGAAVKTGIAHAYECGFSHALQVDADLQHQLDDAGSFLQEAERHPDALILGQPTFDDSAPLGRRIARNISIFWTYLEAGGNVIGDPLCGFRVYPLERALRANARGNRMDFDPEIAVRLVWLGVPVRKLKTKVRYITTVDGGVSHFRLGLDNWLITKLHTRLMLEKIFLQWPKQLFRLSLPFRLGLP